MKPDTSLMCSTMFYCPRDVTSGLQNHRSNPVPPSLKVGLLVRWSIVWHSVPMDQTLNNYAGTLRAGK